MTGFESLPDFVDWENPINREAPLNSGLVFKTMAAGPAYGSKKATDWIARNDGTLTNFTDGYGYVGPLGKPGGWGALRFDGVDDYVLIGGSFSGPISDIGTGDFSVCLWAARSGSTGTYRGFIGNGAGFTQGLWFGSSAGGVLGGYIASASEMQSTYTVPTDLSWHHYAITRQTGIVRMYADGKSAGAGTWTRTGTLYSSSSTLIGYAAGYQYMLGYIDDINIYNRALSSTEVAGLYEASMNFYPTQLNRFAYRPRYVPSGFNPGGFNPAWAARSTITLQPGICVGAA